MVGTATNETAGVQALERLRSSEPAEWLAPNPELSKTARLASEYLFSCLKPYAVKCPFDRLLTDGFDSEQIWQQIDLQTQPLLSTFRREIKKFERNPEEIKKLRPIAGLEEDVKVPEQKGEGEENKKKDNDFDGDYGDDMDMDDMEAFEEDDDEDDDDDDDDEEEKGGREREEEKGEEREGGVEDKFLRINELEKFLKEDEAREYGSKSNEKRRREDEDDDSDVNYEELVGFEGDCEDEGATARYEDFFGSAKKKVLKKKSKLQIDSSSGDEGEEGEEEGDEEGEDDDDHYDDDVMADKKKKDGISTHEKQLAKIQAEIKEMEKANLDPKTWTMQGEVTAATRPKNSALEVFLDFEHNMRPAPVITEEVTASIENKIRQRIIEGRFDDVERTSRITSKAPRELKELDENKSKKGLAEVYEDEFVKKADPGSAPLSFLDEAEKEADLLWKKISLRLDALSHFHFAPKPVVEDMSIQANVPALAMEEIAPVAVSDAAMLAPEEVFTGKGDIKEEAELTQAERNRRRANKKRKFKTEAAKRNAKKARDNTLVNHNDGKEAS